MTEDRVLAFLKEYHVGFGNEIASRELERSLHIKGQTLREIVNSLRCNGYPICSNQNGYFYASALMDVQKTINQLSHRIQRMGKAREGLQLWERKYNRK
ncbi:hypothetical protein [Ethanoligenens sp.]|uniref:hypothetical protein n=1 Tax=Ethanoligenens sp. TaxID=2099655 RepID=UPI0039EB7D75